jgi:hypothetical protein
LHQRGDVLFLDRAREPHDVDSPPSIAATLVNVPDNQQKSDEASAESTDQTRIRR